MPGLGPSLNEEEVILGGFCRGPRHWHGKSPQCTLLDIELWSDSSPHIGLHRLTEWLQLNLKKRKKKKKAEAQNGEIAQLYVGKRKV